MRFLFFFRNNRTKEKKIQKAKAFVIRKYKTKLVQAECIYTVWDNLDQYGILTTESMVI